MKADVQIPQLEVEYLGLNNILIHDGSISLDKIDYSISLGMELDKEGRGSVIIFEHQSKLYLKRQSIRGGIWSKPVFSSINSTYYLTSKGSYRQKIEFLNHLYLYNNGISCPKPLGCIIKKLNLRGYGFNIFGLEVYSGSFISEYIVNARTLTEVAEELTDSGIRKVMSGISEEVSKMINLGVFHSDLHPSNVLIGPKLEVYLIDFDASVDFNNYDDKEFEVYTEKTKNRWNRAVKKYQLPNSLSKYFNIKT